MYIDRVDPEKYNEYVSGWSLSRRMKKAWANSIGLCSHTYYILELCFEQNLCKETGMVYLYRYSSPYVLADMLSVLCNYRLRNPSQCLLSPTDLQTLLFNDDGSCETSRGRYCESVSTLWGTYTRRHNLIKSLWDRNHFTEYKELQNIE